MADGFVTAVGADGKKRRVPAHYLDNPSFGFKLPPSARAKAQEPAKTSTTKRVRDPAAASAKTTVTEPAAAGEK